MAVATGSWISKAWSTPEEAPPPSAVFPLGRSGQVRKLTSIAASPVGDGYWVFTTLGRVLAFGDVDHFGDMTGVSLNGPVLDAVATPSGHGYRMVASDGGVFSSGTLRSTARWADRRLNQPVRSLVADPDGVGYWLVASDGGVFAFEADFRGVGPGESWTQVNISTGSVTGMVAYGDGYVMVGADGGVSCSPTCHSRQPGALGRPLAL